MSVNKIVDMTLKALSRRIDVKKHYKLYRRMLSAVHHHFLKRFYHTWDHQIILGDHVIPVRIFSPSRTGDFPLLVFFHGGGWVLGNIDSYSKVCTNLAKGTNRIVVSVDYRLAPEHPFPAALDDCYRATLEIFFNAALFGAKPEEITLVGDSAGANLAAAVSLMARDRGEFLPSKQILIYPATYDDHSPKSPFPSIRENGTGYILTAQRLCDYMDLYKGDNKDLKSPYFAPLLAEDFTCQPATLVITAQYDPLRDEGEAYGQKLKEAGNDAHIYRLPDAQHGFFTLSPRLPQVQKCYQIINQFLNDEVIAP